MREKVYIYKRPEGKREPEVCGRPLGALSQNRRGRFSLGFGYPGPCPILWAFLKEAEPTCFLPASYDRWTVSRRFPWQRRFSPPRRELFALLGRPLPWQRGTGHGLQAVAATETLRE